MLYFSKSFPLLWLAALATCMLLVCACSKTTPTQTLESDILIDVNNLAQPYLGIGAQIWAGDTAWIEPLEHLNARWVRVTLAPSFDQTPEQAPANASREEMDAYLNRNFNAVYATQLEHALATWNRLQARDMTMILHMWEAPAYWESGGALKTARIPDYVRLWGALLRYLDHNGIRPTWIELSNEPDGDWNTRIHPSDYNALVKTVREELDARGFTDVGILGPGLSTLNHSGNAERWIGSLDAEAVAALGGWSAHTWDDYAERGEGIAFLDRRWMSFTAAIEAKDPEHQKPIFITELGSKDTEFNGVRYTSPNNGTCGDAADSLAYAVRVIEYLILSLNQGAGAHIIWQAADQSWECGNWGLVTAADEGAEPRPLLHALSSIVRDIPADARVIRPTWHDSGVQMSALRSENTAILIMANSTSETLSCEISLTGVDTFGMVQNTTFSADGVSQKTNNSAENQNTLHVNLAPESTESLILEIQDNR